MEGKPGISGWTTAGRGLAWDTMSLLPHQQRVVEEEAELADRLKKLGLFFTTEIYATLEVEEQLRLRRQQSAMADYLAILQDRIVAFHRGDKAQQLEKQAADLYTVYCAAVGGAAFNGDPLPDWETFQADESKAKQVNAWREVAAEALGLH